MNINLYPRTGFSIVLGLCLALLGYAYYSQYAQGYEPCPLCILQRWAFIIIALGALAGAIHGSRGGMRWLYGGIVFAGGAWGVATAGRHLWLQSLPPDQVPACGPSLDYMFEAFPLAEVLTAMTRGTGDCAAVSFQFLGITLPGWALLGFAGLAVLAVLQLRAGNQWGSAYRS